MVMVYSKFFFKYIICFIEKCSQEFLQNKC